MGPHAAKVLMKILYGARMARFDLLRAVGGLASRITTWTSHCDARLYRLVCYINSTKDLELRGYIGDPMDKLELKLYSDADFAGCKKTRRSTSGVFLCISGPNTWYPLAAISKKQTCVSHSTPEAEIVAMDLALRAEGLPAQDLWDVLLQRKVFLTFEEDNTAAIAVVKTGKNPTMRHLDRTHGVCEAWLREHLATRPEEVNLVYCESAKMAADILTKGFTDQVKWQHATSLVGLVGHKEKLDDSGEKKKVGTGITENRPQREPYQEKRGEKKWTAGR